MAASRMRPVPIRLATAERLANQPVWIIAFIARQRRVMVRATTALTTLRKRSIYAAARSLHYFNRQSRGSPVVNES
jgi:hypothetical protein